MAKDRLMGEVWQEYDELNERLEELSSKLQKNLDEAQLIDDDERRIFAAFDSASGEEDKTALLFEAKELQQRRKHFMEEVGRLTEKFDEYRASQGALKDRVNERLDDIRTAALETERMLFEIGKLVATLAIGTIVAMAAVTPALVPQLENLEGMWPAFRWLLISLVVSVFMCVYSMTQVSQQLGRLRGREETGSRSGHRGCSSHFPTRSCSPSRWAHWSRGLSSSPASSAPT